MSDTKGSRTKSWTCKVRLKGHSICWAYGLLLALIFLCDTVLANILKNHAPRFLIDGQTEIVLRLKEGAETPVGSRIYRLRGYDPDNDTLTFGLQHQADNEILRIENLGTTEADVYLKKELDREVKDEYTLVLTLTDGKLGEGNFITQSLLLLVEDVNDNEPIFKPYQPTIRVREDSGPHVLTTVEATDLDEGPYGQVLYSLQELDGDDDMFSITTLNGKGIIRLVGQLDYERKFLYQLRVMAVDRANNERVNTGTAAILVKVEDVEDQPPEFVVVTPVTRVSEDARIGTPVLQVKAVDGDRGINNSISYSIKQGSQDFFDIEPKTGIVYTLKSLDRERPNNSNGAYILEIMAKEDSKTVSPPPFVKTEVTVIITDVNDEIPTFRSESYLAEVNENAQANTPVTFLNNAIPEVFDHDQGKNGTFIMFIEGDRGIFYVTPPKGINEASFLIRVKDPTRLDFERVKMMNFTLIAKETVPHKAKYSLVPVTVYVRDMNDNFPEFTQPYYEVSVPENSGVGTTVAWVQALDEDSGNYGSQGIRYTSLSGSVSDLLTLDQNSGIITIKSDGSGFDRELVSRHYLTVEARDDLGFGNRNTVQLVVNIEDVNDNAPVFLQNKYEARLWENHMEFESPLYIEAVDLDLNGTNNSQIQYSIIRGDPYNNFTIDPMQGVLKPATHIDFEQLAGAAGDVTGRGVNVRPITMVVEAKDMGTPSLSSEVLVTVYVQDVNDHSPQFEQDDYRRSIPEDIEGGSSILQVKAWDNDGSSPNNAIVYRIQRGAEDKFVIDADTGVISVAHGANLDPDRTDPKTTQYSLRVVALDGGIGTEQRAAVVDVNISIVDVNNKVPILVDPGSIRVKENTQVGQFVHHVIAVDPDDKPVLRYHIDAENSEARSEEGTIIKSSEYDYVSLFDLNPLDGQLRVVKLLDRERVETIRLGIKVEDLAASREKQTSSAILTIIVEDENDNNPKFRRPFYRRSITENSKNGVTIINVVADDADKNRSITYSLEGPRDATDLVHLDSETGEIVVASKIDHELFPFLNFTVRATDSGIPPRSSLVDVFIQVLDENDNNPYFVGDVNNITVREDAPVGTEIATIEARDADSGDFGKITYLLDRMSSQGKFQINPRTGVLNVSDKLNREEQNTYMLVIEAWDNYQFGYVSGESRNAFKQIGVNIVDVNDEVPVFEPIFGCVTITEFHDVHDIVTVVKASDADDPNTPNGRILFSIAGGNELGLFSIENTDFSTARIMITQHLKGLYGNYSLIVQAQDLGIPPNSAVTQISICVTDFNDNAPRFISPQHNTTIRVPENATLGSVVIQVQAIDDDIGPNAAVRYRLKQDSMGNWRTFSIDEMTGVIVLKKELDREKQKIYEIRVEAYDLGIPTPLSSDLDLTVYVRNVNDYEPQFLVDEYHINFTEHSEPGQERRKLIDTVDRDEVDELDDPPSQVCYFIVGGNEGEFFSIDKFQHEIVAIKELDREIHDTHMLLVKASEDCVHTPENQSFFDPSDDTLLKVMITVNDINDNAPRFVKRVFTGGVTTEADFGTEFMQVKAVDFDEGKNAVVSYYQIGRIQKTLTEGLENIQKPPFLVNPETGAVSLNFDPQKGMKGYFDFMVLANDTDGLQDMARVFIYLLREDQRVRFVLRQHPPEVRERIDIFREVLGNVTGAIVNVDEFKVHENQDGSVDKTRTDLYLHFVDRRDNSIMEVTRVLNLVDQNIERLDKLFKEFNVLDTQPAEALPLKEDMEGLVMMWLVGTTVFLGLLLILVVSICLSQRARYQRQLKAATVTAFGSNESDLNRVTGRVPNTNMHSVEGSNPIWMQAYENEWYKEDDSVSQASERDSLDENAVVNEDARQTPQGAKPFYGQTCIYPDSCNRSNIVNDGSAVSEQNDLNRMSTNYHQNLYQHLDKLSNPLLSKKLETTEL
ncbi:cadherin-23 isoform X2 [Periplaneta americana]|uniref:cadherin-23 isoform X2 n=1 Tax=Periplaneta americana TaxID=6978 RepID=UPI0037E952D3